MGGRRSRPSTGLVGLKAAIEALGRAVARIELDAADEGGGTVALRFQKVREVWERGRQRAADFAHAGGLRISAEKDGCVRHDGSGRLSIGVFKDDAFDGQAVEIQRESGLSAQKAHSVGARGIKRDEDEIGLGGGCSGWHTDQGEKD